MEKGYIDNIYFTDPELFKVPYDKSSKKMIVDIYIKNEEKEKEKEKKHLIFEMQTREVDDIILRADIALSLIIDKNTTSGENYIFTEELYSIVLLYYDIYDEKEYFHNYSYEEILKVNNGRKLNVKEKFVIELKKILKSIKYRRIKRIKKNRRK